MISRKTFLSYMENGGMHRDIKLVTTNEKETV